MVRILITPEQVDTASQKFAAACEQARTMTSELNSTIEGMSGEWSGMTKEKFFSQFQEAKTAMNHFCELLTAISQDLKRIAERFRAADQG
jgi:WXG100 family type VII secretion target